MGLALALAVVAVYANSLNGPFVFDDLPGIVENASLRHLGAAWSPPANTTLSGRPVANFTLALNHWAGGLQPRGYHVGNLLIHLAATLAVFGVVRRTLLLQAKFVGEASWLAATVAFVWALHPLHTESVTYVVQRTESLAAAWLLLTLYCFIRGATDGPAKRWFPLAFGACALGMGTKETMVVAPLLVLGYDRVFLAGSFRAALRQRGWIHAALALTWLELAWLVVSTGGARDGSAGFGRGITAWDYLLTQGPAIVHYLRLAAWPQPLVFDYGKALPMTLAAAAPAAVLVLGLIVMIPLTWRRWPAIAFLIAVFFLLLAPSSSVVPVVTQGRAEHRMYLPLVAVIGLAGCAAYARMGRKALYLGFAAGAGLGAMTVARNQDYRSAVALWSDTVAHRPGNPRAWHNLGLALADAGRPDEALDALQTAVRSDPADAEGQKSLADILQKTGRLTEAVVHYEAALQARATLAGASYGFGQTLLALNRAAEAVPPLQAALRADPANTVVRANLGSALAQAGRLGEAIAEYEAALRLKPDYLLVLDNLGLALLQAGRVDEAQARFAAAVKLSPDDALLHFHWGFSLALAGQVQAARRELETALRLKPDFAPAREALAQLP